MREQPMTDPIQTTPPHDWPSLWSALAQLDGDAWDAESDRLDALWLAEYEQAFVGRALTRGWARGDAEVWADAIAGDAMLARGRESPAEVAGEDVRECEMEAV